MQLLIKSTRLISEVQKDFSEIFPYLKLEFFRHKSGNGKGTLLRAPHNFHISDCNPKVEEGEFQIQKGMTVRDLEQGIKKQFGLNVQVFRQSGNLWLQTTVTDNWTLEKQNEHGKELSVAQQDEPVPDREDNDI